MKESLVLSATSIGLIVAGFGMFLVGALSRGYIRARLRESGDKLGMWSTVISEFRHARRYHHLVQQGDLPFWPLITMPAGFLAGYALAFGALIFR